MSIQRLVLVTIALVVGCIALGTAGCVMRRTVTEGDSVVAQGYVVKAPLIGR